MKIEDNILKIEEKITYQLRSLYHESGYVPFKMTRFERYDMYAQNKDFLDSGDIVTFTDPNGKLLALKPDVTLSIIKNYKSIKGCVSKFYYNENVYRSDKGTHEIKEIMQSGIECMGDISAFDECEVIMLAVKSLEKISPNYILDISSAKIINGLLEAADLNIQQKKDMIKLFERKNAPALRAFCQDNNIGSGISEIALGLCQINKKAKEAVCELEKLCINREMTDGCNELKSLMQELEKCNCDDNIYLDFSIVSDTNYYSGIVFRGYVDNLPESVLFGGRYDNLLKNMGKNGGAIGFAVNCDMLERIDTRKKEYDCDVLLTYENGVDFKDIENNATQLRQNKLTVNVQKNDIGQIRYKKLVKITKDGEIIDG